MAVFKKAPLSDQQIAQQQAEEQAAQAALEAPLEQFLATIGWGLLAAILFGVFVSVLRHLIASRRGDGPPQQDDPLLRQRREE